MVHVSEPDEPSAAAVTTPPGITAEAEHPALVAYRARTSRNMRIYAIVLSGIVLLAFVGVRLAYAHGELNKVSAVTAPAPAGIAPLATASKLDQVWHSSDRPAGGSPYADGIVVSYDAHTVTGRDALTGASRWHYTRSDETVCSVVQQDATTIAIYDRKGNCDEVTGFVTATGVAKWYRTLQDNGISAVTSAPNVVLTVTDHSVHVFDNAGGLDRWNWAVPDGCIANRALVGSLGVLVSLTCGSNHQLVLRDEFQDRTTWTVNAPAAVVPIAASAFVGALDPATGTVLRYSGTKGTAANAGRLSDGFDVSGMPRAAASLTGTGANGQPVEYLYADRLYALSAAGTVVWSASATAPPGLLDSALIAVPAGAGHVVLHRQDTGAIQLTSVLNPAPAPDQQPFQVGAGLLLAGADITMYR
jgi:hypothetical protein